MPITTPWDEVPDFSENPTICSQAAGLWSSPATWDLNRVPQAGDVVWVSHPITYDLLSDEPLHTVGIRSGGTLTFQPDLNTRLWLVTLLVLPGGTLEVGTPQAPLLPHRAAEVVFRSVPPSDPHEYEVGLLVWGRVTCHGAAKTPFVRCGEEVLAGDDSVRLTSSPVGWRLGDRLLLPPTKSLYYTDGRPAGDYASEVFLLAAWAPDQVSCFDQPAAYDHPGGPDALGLTAGRLPHLANLTRNVVFRSENSSSYRAHVFLTYRAEVSLYYCLFQDLGRTTGSPGGDHVGRYSLHLHHLHGPPPGAVPLPPAYQFEIVGCVLDGCRKWGLAAHDAHYGLLRDNIVHDCREAGLVLEDGSESYNHIEGNLVCRVGHPDNPLADCYWFKGIAHNIWRNNVACGAARPNTLGGNTGTGYHLDYVSLSPAIVRLPAYRGASPVEEGQYVEVDAYRSTWAEFAGNEAYGMDVAYWDDHHEGPPAGKQVRNFVTWNCDGGLGSVYGGRTLFETVSAHNFTRVGWLQQATFGPVSAVGVVLDSGVPGAVGYYNIAGASSGTDYFLQDAFIRCTTGAIICLANAAGSSVDPSFHKTVTFQDTTFTCGDSLILDPTLYGQSSFVPCLRNEVRLVSSGGGHLTENLRVYWEAQHPDALVPATTEIPEVEGQARYGAPAPGLPNAHWHPMGFAVAGAQASCTLRRPGIVGFVCEEG